MPDGSIDLRTSGTDRLQSRLVGGAQICELPNYLVLAQVS